VVAPYRQQRADQSACGYSPRTPKGASFVEHSIYDGMSCEHATTEAVCLLDATQVPDFFECPAADSCRFPGRYASTSTPTL
jgi:hypothetical protein